MKVIGPNIRYASNKASTSSYLKNYYQWVIARNSIITKDGKWYYANKGTGGSAVDVQIKDTMVLNSGGDSRVDVMGTESKGYLVEGFNATVQFNYPVLEAGYAHILTKRITDESGNWGISTLDNKPTFFYTTDTGVFVLDIIVNYTISINTWYTIDVNITGGNVIIDLYDAASVLLGTFSKAFVAPTSQSASIIKMFYIQTFDVTNTLISYAYVKDVDKWYFQDGQGVTIKGQLGLYDGTLIGATQSIAWGTRSDAAKPALQIEGHSDYLVTTIVGSTSHPSDPSGWNFGVELHTNANAVSDPNGNEANTVTGFTGRNLTSGANVFASQSVVVNIGTYAIEANSNDAPVNTAGFYTDLEASPFGCTDGKTYKITFYARHVGSGGDWFAGLGSADTVGNHFLKIFDNTEIDFVKITYIWTHDSTYRYFGMRELSSSNNGGVYFDAFSVKEAVGLVDIPIPAIYEFSHKSNNTDTAYYFVNSSTLADPLTINSYRLNILSTGQLQFYKANLATNVLLGETTVSYIDPTLFYQYRIQVGYDGMFGFEIKGGAFVDWTLIVFAGAINPNPFKDATYLETRYITYDDLTTSSELSHVKKKDVICGDVIGDSTITEFIGQYGVGELLFQNYKYFNNNVAESGDTIDEQKAEWTALLDKDKYDWVIIQIGLNDLIHTDPTTSTIARLQSLVDTIIADKKTSCKVIISSMLLAHERLVNIYGATNGELSYQKQLDINTSIMGGGANPITGVDARNDYHVSILSDENGDLKPEYDTGDHIHPNDAGRAVIATGFYNSVLMLGIPTINTEFERYDPYHFADGTGTTVVRNSIGVTTLLDADGNELEIAPNAGFSNTGNTVMQPAGDTTLLSLSEEYNLGWYGVDENNPLSVDWDTLKAYDLSVIPDADFDYALSEGGEFIKDMISISPLASIVFHIGEVVIHLGDDVIHTV